MRDNKLDVGQAKRLYLKNIYFSNPGLRALSGGPNLKIGVAGAHYNITINMNMEHLNLRPM